MVLPRFLHFAWVAAATSCLGCSAETDRPAPPPSCDSEECRRVGTAGPIGVGAGGRGAVGSASGASSGSGGSGLGSVPIGTLAGTVAEIVEPDQQLGGAPSGTALTVRASAPGGGQVEGSVSSGGSFRIDGVSENAEWVGVGPFEDGLPYVDTLQRVDVTSGGMLQLRVMSRGLLEEMVRDFFLLSPLELRADRAYAVITVVDRDGAPVSGAFALTLPSSDSAIAYDAGDIYSDSADATSLRGSAVLANVSAVDYPGELVAVEFQVGATSYRVEVQMAAGSLSLATLELPP